MIKSFKIFENIKKNGDKLKDTYFKKNMWYIDNLLKKNTTRSILMKSRKTFKLLKELDVDFRIFLYIEDKFKGLYFFFNEENKDILEKNDINLLEVPEGFYYPNNFENYIVDHIPTEKEISFYLDLNKYNL